MLSKLWYFRLLDDRGQRHVLADIAVALLKSDYPVVTDLRSFAAKVSQTVETTVKTGVLAHARYAGHVFATQKYYCSSGCSGGLLVSRFPVFAR